MPFSQSDVALRIRALLPNQWFGDVTPVLNAVLGALAAGWDGFFSLLFYAETQTRIATAAGFWLDLISRDFFGERLRRGLKEADGSFRVRIGQEIVRDRCTRSALSQYIVDATGIAPIIFEPENPSDTGCYGQSPSSGYGIIGYGRSGGWGTRKLPFQAFVLAYRPVIVGVSTISGWSENVGSFGGGLSAYANSDLDSAQMTDDDIYSGIFRIGPAGCKIWTAIE